MSINLKWNEMFLIRLSIVFQKDSDSITNGTFCRSRLEEKGPEEREIHVHVENLSQVEAKMQMP